MPKRETTVNGLTINTRHFIAMTDAKNDTFAMYGDFCDTEITKLNDIRSRFNELHNELRDLESMPCRMMELEGSNDQPEDGA